MSLTILSILLVAPSGHAAPCAPPNAPDPMPHGGTHDHTDPAQHAFSCAIDEVATLDFAELVPEPVLFGEVDIAGDIAIVATAWPEAGFIVVDIADPASPVALSRYFGPVCEEPVSDVDCGADVKLTPDGRTAFIAVQNFGRGPTVPRNPQAVIAPAEPGIIVVDLSDRTRPLFHSWLPVEPFGVHMQTYHEIAGVGYLFMVDNFHGLQIARLDTAGPIKHLVPVHVAIEGVPSHDFSVYDDPVDGKTYLYVASGFHGGLLIFDVSDPAAPVQVGEWVAGTWYSHSVATARYGGRRYTFLAPELFNQSASNRVGPIWLLDTTDHANPVHIGTWTNPGGRRGGNLGFSPHNFSLAPDAHTWLAHYHGGVWLLDWRPVIDGSSTRPLEVGYHVPHTLNRPFATARTRFPFMSGFELNRRPSVWDVVTDGTNAFASDIRGGLLVLRRSP